MRGRHIDHEVADREGLKASLICRIIVIFSLSVAADCRKSKMSADSLFQKTLQDLVKGIRSNKKDPSSYISQAIAEIKSELKSVDPFLKSEAVSI